MEYDCIIIGAGAGGLSAALKLSSVGKRVMVLEKQPLPGGFAAGFCRKGFSFESALHCVDALAQGQEIRDFLDDCGIKEQVEFIDLKDFARIIYPEHDFVADFQRDNFIDYLKKSFPAQAGQIDRLFLRLDSFYRQLDRFDDSALPDWMNLLLSPVIYPQIIRISLSSTGQLLDRYISDPRLKAILADIWRFIGLPPSELSAFYFLIVLEGYYFQPTAYVRGGYQKLFQAMVDKIREYGSQVKFNTTVAKIITEKRRIKSVATEEGNEYTAKAVISNANAIATLTVLLDDQRVRADYEKKLSVLEKSISAFQVYLGLDIPAKTLGMGHFQLCLNTSYDHEENYHYSLDGDYDRCLLQISDHAQIDPSLVPPGKGSLLIMTYDTYAHWQGLGKEEYQKRKTEFAHKLIRRTEKYLPGLGQHIELMEIATPMTMQRYGACPEGAIYGFAQTVAQSGIARLSQKTVIPGLFLSGAWTFPGGGVHGCFVSGKEAADLVLRYSR